MRESDKRQKYDKIEITTANARMTKRWNGYPFLVKSVQLNTREILHLLQSTWYHLSTRVQFPPDERSMCWSCHGAVAQLQVKPLYCVKYVCLANTSNHVKYACLVAEELSADWIFYYFAVSVTLWPFHCSSIHIINLYYAEAAHKQLHYIRSLLLVYYLNLYKLVQWLWHVIIKNRVKE